MHIDTTRLAAVFLVCAVFGLAIWQSPRLARVQHDPTLLAGAKWEHRATRPFDQRFNDLQANNAKQSFNILPQNYAGAPQPTFVREEQGQVPQNLFLRIETKQHSAELFSIDIDAEHRYLITGADDKTARVWAAPRNSGESFSLLKILRPPIGTGNVGKIWAVAISPDGATVAIGGWTRFDWENSHSVYLFDRQSGQLIHRLTDLPNVTLSLAFSPNGDFLVVGLGKPHGVRVFRANDDWSTVEVEGQSEYGDSVYGLSFAADGRLATGSYDGHVRLYTPDFRLKAIRQALEGDEIYGVAFSNDNKIAVSSPSRPFIAVVSGNNLEELYRPAVSDLPQSERYDMSDIAWSSDARSLYAGGRAAKLFDPQGNRNFVRQYVGGGRGAFIDIPVGRYPILGIKTAREGVFFGAQDPIFGMIDNQGLVSAWIGPVTTDMKQTAADIIHSQNSLRVSSTGASVSLPFDSEANKYWIFKLAERQLKVSEAEAVEFASPVIPDQSLNNSDWVDTPSPAVNGIPLALEEYERSQSLAIVPAGDKYLIGTTWNLRLYDANGDQVWEKQPAPGIVWRVNISADERLAVAAYGDGTVRWHDMRDGRELLALLITRDHEAPQWVAWTPAGYYDASPGAEDLIGWHINQGADREALFFSASRFRDLYYRPDIIKNALKTRHVEAPPTRDALLAAAPPIVNILGQRLLPNGDVVIDYEVTTIFGEPVEIDIFVDNAKVDMEGARNQSLSGERQSITVPKGGCATDSIAIIARSSDGRASDAALVGRQALIGAVCDPGDAPKPDLHALLIGVSEYSEDSLTDLNFAHRDAHDLEALLEAQKDRAYDNVSVKVLTNQQATKTNIETALADIEVAADDNDVTILFFAGHGVKSDRLNDVFFLAHDSNINKLSTTAIEFVRFKTAVRRMHGRRFVFLDACFSAFASTEGLSLFDMQGVSSILGGSDIRAEVFASSTGDQVSFENAAWENGAFTETMLELFNNKIEVESDELSEILLQAYSGDGQITNDELNNWVKTRVKTLTNNRQTPSHTAAGSTSFMIIETPVE